jgi:hypothetical protein
VVFIPYAQSYNVSATGSVVKLVECESCKGEYVYKLTRQGEGSGTSMLFLDNEGAQGRAEQEARQLLLERLLTSCDPVPCPFCGWYQQNMVDRMRRHHQGWMITVGFLAGFAAFVCCLVAAFFTTRNDAANYVAQSVVFWLLTAVLGIAAPALIWGKHYLARIYDPNQQDVEKRKELGRYRAMSKADFMKMEQSEQSRDH